MAEGCADEEELEEEGERGLIKRWRRVSARDKQALVKKNMQAAAPRAGCRIAAARVLPETISTASGFSANGSTYVINPTAAAIRSLGEGEAKQEEGEEERRWLRERRLREKAEEGEGRGRGGRGGEFESFTNDLDSA